ncbi:protein Hikeshi-like [Actinia tenebrosa]|uniref:Protein Hikeshi-like n=1 Tax=Actinia tenebrosa TaxID=6105 RepID=A0A6P8IZE4_ACTTE|nr:protein Hikeshi-like [Actinia tenebrosa]
MASMFGCVVCGRLVQTDAQQVGPTQVVFNLPDADSIQHIVIFLTGAVPFPDNMGGAVYYCFPSPQGQSWQLLGFISNAKPSAIFKISKAKPEDVVSNPFSLNVQQQDHTMAQIGISIEPLTQLAQQTPVANATPTTLNTFVQFTQKMMESFVNYASSFSITQTQMTPNPSESFIPMSVVQKWYLSFERKLACDPNFWKN